MAGTSSIAGLSTGFDWAATVDQLIAVERKQITSLQNKQALIVAKQDAMATLNDKMRTLRYAALDMSSASQFFTNSANMSSSSAVSPASLLNVKTNSTAAAGTHSIVVQQTAQAMKLGSGSGAGITPIASNNTALGLTGSFTLNGATINVTAANTLQDIANSINQAGSGASASVVMAATGDYRLVIAADQTGSSGLTLTGADLESGGALASLNLGTTTRQTLQAGQDAIVTIDGLNVTRSSNTISDALAGVTLNLQNADPATTITLDISLDTQAVKDKVQGFVDAYNSVSQYINDQMKFDSATNTSGILAGESALRSIQMSLSSSVLQSVPGLAGDRNNMVLLGIAPDDKGNLQIDQAKLDKWLQTDPTAVRDIFSANGSSGNSNLKFVTYGAGTASGSYAVNITQPATQATVTGTTDLSAGLAANETLTITQGASQAVVALTAGQSLSSIVSTLNNEFSQTYTEQRQLSGALTVGGTPATGTNTFADLGLGIAAGDTITISGTDRNGGAVNHTYTVMNPATDTIDSLLSSIKFAFNQQVNASIDVNGKINITDTQAGNSNLTFAVTANNEGGGTLNFGTESVITEGRYALNLSANASGNFLQITDNAYGSGSSFSVLQSANNLGIVDQAYTGQNVAGTIGGIAATGWGTGLTGSSGNVSGLVVSYTGTATGNVGTLNVGLGIGAVYDNMLQTFSNPVTGLIQNSIMAQQTNYDSLTKKIVDMDAQINRHKQQMLGQFQRMETAMAKLNTTGQWLTQQIAQSSSSSGN